MTNGDFPFAGEAWFEGLSPLNKYFALTVGSAAIKNSGLVERVEKLQHEATHDPLTDSLNRRGLEEYLRGKDVPQALLLIDADNFKAVNTRLGYRGGDQVVIDTRDLLRGSIRRDDEMARWGGDEFVLILNGVKEPAVSPDDPMAYEKRAKKPSHIEHIDEVKKRIAENVREFLETRPDLKEIGFNLSVGSIEWVEGIGIEEMIALTEADLKAHKDSHRESEQSQEETEA